MSYGICQDNTIIDLYQQQAQVHHDLRRLSFFWFMKAEEGNPFLLALHIEIAAKGRKIRVPTADRQL